MELKWAHLCTDAVSEGPLLSIVNYTNALRLPGPPELRLPGALRLAYMIHAHQNEGRNGEPMIVEIADQSGTVVETIGPQPVKWQSVDPGKPLVSGNVVTTGGWHLPNPGIYGVRISIGGNVIAGRSEFFVYPPEGLSSFPPPPRGTRARGMSFVWGHIADDFTLDRQTGLPLIRNIRDFIPLARDAARDQDRVLLAAVTFGSQESRGHVWSADLLDADGRKVGEFNEGPFTGMRAGPGHLWWALGIMKLAGVVVYGDTGDYVYRVFVDRKRVGEVPIWLLRT